MFRPPFFPPEFWPPPPLPIGFPFPPSMLWRPSPVQLPVGSFGFAIPSPAAIGSRAVLPSSSPVSDVNSDDRSWVRQWLEGKGKGKNVPSSRKASDSRYTEIKLADAKELVGQAFELLGLLQQLHNEMAVDVGMSAEEWEENVVRATSVKESLTSVQTQVTDPEVQAALQLQIDKKRKRRARLKQRKQRKWNEEQERRSKSQQLSQEIDEWRAKLIAAGIASKRESELRLEAGETLTEVKAKQREAEKMKQLLDNLKELRAHRLESSHRWGGDYADEDIVFRQGVEKLALLIDRQQESYRSEEKTLKTLMEEEGEAVEQEQLKLVREVAKREETVASQGDPVASQGDPVAPHDHDPMKEFIDYYHQADHFIESFIGIRHMWDAFVVPSGVPGSSRIPDGWVEAGEPSSAAWEQYLSTDRTKSVKGGIKT